MSRLGHPPVSPPGPPPPLTDRPGPGAARLGEARPALRAGWAAAALLVLGVGGWMALAVIEGAILAEGHLVSAPVRPRVQHPEGGRVREVLVHEDEAVAAGQALLRLDPGPLEAERALLDDRIAAAQARHARLEAERDEAPELRSGAPDPYLEGERRLLAARRAALALQGEALAARIAQAEAQRAGLRAQQTALAAEIAEQARDLAGQEALAAAGTLPAARLVPLRREAHRLTGAQAALAAELAAIDGRLADLALQGPSLQAQRREEIEAALQDTSDVLAELVARRRVVADRIDRTILRAPVAGRVLGLAVAGPGALIGPGETVLDLVPEGPAMTALAAIHPEEADRLHPGHPVRLRLPATGGRPPAELEGRVVRLSADALEEPRSGRRIVLAEIAVVPGATGLPEGRVLRPGLPVEVQFRTGARSPWAWLMAPLVQHFDRALRPD